MIPLSVNIFCDVRLERATTQSARALVLARYSTSSSASDVESVHQNLLPVIKNWAGANLLDVSFSGSCANGTSIKGSTDVDLFISLSPYTSGSARDIDPDWEEIEKLERTLTL